MVLSYDALFEWLTGSTWNSHKLIISQPEYPSATVTRKGELEKLEALKVPAEILNLPHQGLERLVGNKLIVGSAANPSGNIQGEFNEVEVEAVAGSPNINYQVFEFSDGQTLTDGVVLPLVARIKSGAAGKFKWIKFEYCAAALKYFK